MNETFNRSLQTKNNIYQLRKLIEELKRTFQQCRIQFITKYIFISLFFLHYVCVINVINIKIDTDFKIIVFF